MRDIVKDAATLTTAKQYRDSGYSPYYLLDTYFPREEQGDVIEFLVEMELLYKVYPKNEWLHTDYDKKPELFWQEY